MVKIKYANDPNKLQSELKELNKIQGVNENLHEIKQETLVDYIGEFEMFRRLTIADQTRETHTRIRNITEYEAYIKAIDQDYESDDAIFNGYNYKIDTPQFKLVNRSQYGNGCDYKLWNHEIIEYRDNNCFIPTKGYCFVKYINFSRGKDYKQHYLDFMRNEKRRSNIMTKTRIQLICRANNFDLGYFDGIGVVPRSVTEKNIALFFYNNHFCLIWISEKVSFNQAIKELKDNFKVVDTFKTEENVKSHFIYESIQN